MVTGGTSNNDNYFVLEKVGKDMTINKAIDIIDKKSAYDRKEYFKEIVNSIT